MARPSARPIAVAKRAWSAALSTPRGTLALPLSRDFWGMVWGVPGMFLCVPLTVIGMIILSRHPTTRWVAVLLSKDGKPKAIPRTALEGEAN